MPDTKNCFFCGIEAPFLEGGSPYRPGFDCPVCGRYRLVENPAARQVYEIGGLDGSLFARAVPLARAQHLLSAVLRDRYETLGGAATDAEVIVRDLDEVRQAARPLAGGPVEAADRVLEYVNRKATAAGARVELRPARDYPIAFASGPDEFSYIVQSIAQPLGYLATADEYGGVRIALGGWSRLQELRKTRVESRRAFVAMSFKPQMTALFDEAILPALAACGYEAFRVDREPHNDKIDDRIIAAIRRSGIVVADFTYQPGGVYYEAGFGQGLGLPVVWTCRRDQVKKLHFDTRQFNHIVWTTPDDLRGQLADRVAATLPTYPPLALPR
jgi:hypothetical protein